MKVTRKICKFFWSFNLEFWSFKLKFYFSTSKFPIRVSKFGEARMNRFNYKQYQVTQKVPLFDQA